MNGRRVGNGDSTRRPARTAATACGLWLATLAAAGCSREPVAAAYRTRGPDAIVPAAGEMAGTLVGLAEAGPSTEEGEPVSEEPPLGSDSSISAAAPRPAAGVRVPPPELLLPVVGIDAEDLEDSFGAPRPHDRKHRGIDIIAPRGTAVVAAVDGWVWKLRRNRLGGQTLYQLDASGEYILYYAHLERYAEGLAEGQPVRRGEVLGYVGDSGNAQGWPHLHLRVGRIHDPARWWVNEPLNPYPLLMRSAPD